MLSHRNWSFSLLHFDKVVAEKMALLSSSLLEDFAANHRFASYREKTFAIKAKEQCRRSKRGYRKKRFKEENEKVKAKEA